MRAYFQMKISKVATALDIILSWIEKDSASSKASKGADDQGFQKGGSQSKELGSYSINKLLTTVHLAVTQASVANMKPKLELDLYEIDLLFDITI